MCNFYRLNWFLSKECGKKSWRAFIGTNLKRQRRMKALMGRLLSKCIFIIATSEWQSTYGRKAFLTKHAKMEWWFYADLYEMYRKHKQTPLTFRFRYIGLISHISTQYFCSIWRLAKLTLYSFSQQQNKKNNRHQLRIYMGNGGHFFALFMIKRRRVSVMCFKKQTTPNPTCKRTAK